VTPSDFIRQALALRRKFRGPIYYKLITNAEDVVDLLEDLESPMVFDTGGKRLF